MLDIQEAVISRWVKGKTIPANRSIAKVVKILGLPIDYFDDNNNIYNNISNSNIGNNNTIQTNSKEAELKDKEIEILKKEIEVLKKELKVWKLGYTLQEQKKRGK